MKNIKYYHFEDDLLKYPDAWCIVVWSRRGPGKTYSTLKYAYENNIPFIYMRRTDAAVERILNVNKALDFDASPYAPLCRDMHIDVVGHQMDDGFGAYYNADEEGAPSGSPLSYVISFNRSTDYKGYDFSRCEWLVFDEFIPQATERVNRKEGELLMDLYMTVSRDRQKRGRAPLKLVLFANAENISVPVTNEIELTDAMYELTASGKTHMWMEDRDILLHHITQDEIPLEESEKVGIYKGMYGTNWFNKAFLGEFSNNDFSNVTKRTIKKCIPFIHLLYKRKHIYVYLNKENGTYYLCTKPNRCMFDYNLNRENEQKLFWMEYGVDLRAACIEERVKFEQFSMYDLIINYKKFFNL